MGSSRLPGKVLGTLGGKPALGHLVDRLRLAKKLHGIVVATSIETADDKISQWCVDNGVSCYRGSENDVLARVTGAQRAMNADVVVEICGDTPYLDPAVVDAGIQAFEKGGVDFVTTARTPSYPQGQDVEIFRRADLEEIEAANLDPYVREHVSVPFYREARYTVADLMAPDGWRRPEVRLLLDRPSDRDFLDALATRLTPEHGADFGLTEILSALDADPGLRALHDAAALEAAA